MLDRAVPQMLVDGLCAVALGAWAPPLSPLRDLSPMQARLGFAFGALCLFFAARTAAAASGWSALEMVSLLIVCGLPLAALHLAEGVLRRHAPRALKLLLTAGGGLVAIAIVITGGRPPASSWGLGAYVLLSLLSITVLLLTRDSASLSRQENAGAAALLSAGLLLTVLSVSDFLPSAPVGLSGVGASLLAFILGAEQRSDASRAWGETAILIAVSALVAFVLSGPLGLRSAVEQLRLDATLLALLLAAGALAGAVARRRPPATQGLADALVRADTGSLDRFLGGLADQPLLAGMRIAQGDLLADYDTQALGALLAAGGPVLTRAAISRPISAGTRAGEELADLMASSEATHAILVCRAPLRIALLTLPDLGPAPEAMAVLALFGKLATLAAGNPR